MCLYRSNDDFFHLTISRSVKVKVESSFKLSKVVSLVKIWADKMVVRARLKCAKLRSAGPDNPIQVSVCRLAINRRAISLSRRVQTTRFELLEESSRSTAL